MKEGLRDLIAILIVYGLFVLFITEPNLLLWAMWQKIIFTILVIIILSEASIEI